jgi:ribosomal protein S27AE/DNA-directed RNA polymerase subunit RPC12/RpoP
LPDWIDFDGDDKDDDAFAGASCAAQSGAGDGYKCDRCDRTFLNQSAVAYVDKKGNFAKCPNPDVHKAIQKARKENGTGFQNFPGLGVSVQQICAVCGEEMHDVQKGEYVTWRPGKDGTMVPFPTNYWMNKAKQTKGVSRGKSSKLRALKTWDERFERLRDIEEGPVKVTSVQVASAMTNEDFCKGLDWITELATFCYMFYGCICGLYPLASNMWWRLKRECVIATAGNTVAGAQKDYRWHCGACGVRWTWDALGSQRLLCVGNFEDENCNAFFAYIGDTKDTPLENTINYLKGCFSVNVWGSGGTVDFDTDS